MSDSRYSYDETAEVWPYFAVTVVGTVVVPVTISRVAHWLSSRAKQADETGQPEHAYNADSQREFRAASKRKEAFSTGNILLAVGWLVLLGLCGVIKLGPSLEDVVRFDPWELLGVSAFASDKEIKSAYRKLSLQFHPDKVKNIANMTTEMIESRFVDLTKAYKALTDEVTKENFRLYGHPDGPQQTSHGIGLPSFLVEGASPVVVAVYVLLGLVTPYKLSRWWYAQAARTRGGLYDRTATRLTELCIKDQPMFMSSERLLEEVIERGAAEYDQKVPGLSAAARKELVDTYLEREPVANELQKLQVVDVTLRVLRGFVPIASEFKLFAVVRRLIELERCLVQAVPVRYKGFGAELQLPGAVLGTNGRPKLAPTSVEEGRKYLPSLRVVQIKAKVAGLPVVVPQSTPYLDVKFVIVPVGAPTPKISPEELDALEDADVNSLTDGSAILKSIDPLSVNKEGPLLPPAVSSYYPGDFTPAWHGFVVNEKDPRFVSEPVVLDHAYLDNLKLSEKELASGDNVTIGTFRIQFTAQMPAMIGKASFVFALVNSAYFGCDVYQRTAIDITNLPQPHIVEEDEEEQEKAQDESDEEGLSDLDTDTEPEDALDTVDGPEELEKPSEPSEPTNA